MSTLQTINIKHPSASTPTITFISSTNQATINAGSASAPVLSFIGDEDTGLWSPAADTVAFSTGGSERMRITSAGNVGIGTSSPATLLHLASDGGAVQRLDRASTDTTSPQFQFRKARGTNASPTAVASGDNIGDVVFFAYDGASFRASARIRSSVDGTPGASDTPGMITFWTTADGGIAEYERMRITSAGNVGIGTSSPARALDVVGSEQLQSFDNNNSASSIAFYKSRGSSSAPTVVQANDFLASQTFWGYDGSTYRAGAAIYAQVDGTPGDSDMPGRLQFLTTTDGSASLTERMRINNAGLITGTGTSLGAWTAYTPTLGGTGWAIGNGTVSGRYCQIGKVVNFSGSVTFGSTSTFGGSALTISLPIARVSATGSPIVVRFRDDSLAKSYLGTAVLTSGATTFNPESQIASTTGELSNLLSTVPFTWATSDSILFSGTYEIA